MDSSDRRSPDIVALVEAALSIMGVRDSATVFGMNSHMRLQFYNENKKEKKLKAVKRRKKTVSKPADHAQPPPLSLAFTRVEADILAAISSWGAKDPICQRLLRTFDHASDAASACARISTDSALMRCDLGDCSQNKGVIVELWNLGENLSDFETSMMLPLETASWQHTTVLDGSGAQTKLTLRPHLRGRTIFPKCTRQHGTLSNSEYEWEVNINPASRVFSATYSLTKILSY